MSNSAVDAVVLCNTCSKAIRACECEREPFNEGDALVALYSGVIRIGEFPMRCHVLNNGVRVIDANDVAGLSEGL